jgi:hypothetical protein
LILLDGLNIDHRRKLMRINLRYFYLLQCAGLTILLSLPAFFDGYSAFLVIPVWITKQ